MDLAGIAVDLYSLVPSAFTAARTARAKEVKASGDAELAKQIGKLPKPSTAAWAVNMLVRAGAEEFGSVLELGTSLARAQEEHDPEALRTLGQQRQPVLSAAVERACKVAEGFGVKVSAAAALEIESTLRAAMTDPAAAEALRSGLLVRSLSTNGLEPVELSDAVAVQGAAAIAAPRPVKDSGRALKAVPGKGRETGTRAGGTGAGTRAGGARAGGARARGPHAGERQAARREAAEPDRDESRRQREKAQAAVDEAERNAEEAATELADAERAKAEAERRRRELEAEVKAAKERLAELQQELASTEWRITLAERNRRQAGRTESRERRAAEEARRRLKQIK
ncbi:hypothetical protein AB6813_08165 [bacterium RCC_150]